jgi:sortase A
MTRRGQSEGRILRGFEYFFLLAGLAALDCYVWINTSALLYQSYEDWAFDQTLRGVQPTVRGFVSAEFASLFSHGAGLPAPEAPSPVAPPLTRQAPAPLLPDMLIGRLEIPRLDLKVMVREGAGEVTLRRAVGHIPGTALPGVPGNVGLAGHRDTFFRPLREIEKNDVIDLETGNGTYQYLVQSTQIVSPRDVGVLKATGGQTLTLVTCYPFYYVGSAPKRFIVRARRIEAEAALNPSRASANPPRPGS